jgi:hypothetical protein
MTILGVAVGAAIAGVVCAGISEVRRWVRIHRLVNSPVPEPVPTDYEREWLAHGRARDVAREVVEDFELLDAYVTDAHCAELEAWEGLDGPPVLPDTPDYVRRLASL